MLDDSFRGAAEENAPPSRPAVGGHNNQVGVDLAGQLTDLFESVPGQNMTAAVAFGRLWPEAMKKRNQLGRESSRCGWPWPARAFREK